MSDAPGPSGRGAPAGPRKSKFVPTVPGRRKKADDGSSQTAAEAAAANSEFAELIKAAGSEASWARGRGRGRGQQRYEVTFGGGGDTKMASASASRAYAGSSGGGRGGSSGRGAAAVAAAAARAAGIKPDPDNDIAMDADGLKVEPGPVGKPPHRNVLDFTQYYPTCLPPRQPYVKGELPGYEMSDGVKPVPVDLATTQDPEDRIADDLHLLDLDDTEHMFLMQLPSVLPARATSAAAGSTKAGTGGTAGGSGPAGTSGRKATTTQGGTGSSGGASGGASGVVEVGGWSSVRDLGSGQLGKLLVFRSGKVKLQMGDVLMDVSTGLTPLHRQDVAALNTNLGHCIMLGDVTQTAVVSPDVMQLIDTKPIPAFRRDLLRRDDAEDVKAAPVKAEEEDLT